MVYSSNVIMCFNDVSRPTTNEWTCRVVKTQYRAFSVASTGNFILSSPDVKPPSELSDRCFQVKINSETLRTVEEYQTWFAQRHPDILGALLYAIHLGLQQRDYEPLMIKTDMPDAYKFVMRVAHSGVLLYSDDELFETLKRRHAVLAKQKRSRVYDNTLAGLIYDLVKSA